MKHIVSFETAKKLEAAGFEMPEPKFGQFWYDLDGQMIILSKVITVDRAYSNFKKVICQSADASHLKYDYDLFLVGGLIYASTVADLLERLKTVYLAYMDVGCCWGCFTIGTATVVGYNANAAEAVAEAFLSQSKQ